MIIIKKLIKLIRYLIFHVNIYQNENMYNWFFDIFISILYKIKEHILLTQDFSRELIGYFSFFAE